MSGSSSYVPGVCNINHAEIAYRRKWAFIGLGVTIALAAILFALDANRWLRISLFLPAFIGAIGYLQSKNKFCVSYAASGLENATDGNTAASAVSEANKAKDRAKARTMNSQAAIAALFVTIVALLV